MNPFSGIRKKHSVDYISRRRRTRIAVILSAFALFAFALSIIAASVDKGPFSSAGGVRPVPKSAIVGRWKDRQYDEILLATGNSLGARPIDPFYLVFNGLASFYKAVGIPENDERTALLDNTVVSIRKALASGNRIPVRAQAEYVLGKTYFHKGPEYYDLSAKYLEESVNHGYQASDSHEYLGALYSSLGNNDLAASHFEKALATSKSDLLLLATAKVYTDSGESTRAETLLQEIISSGTDTLVREKAGLLLGGIFRERKDFARAEELFNSVLSKNAESAEAYYNLGLIHQDRGDPVRARAAWRKAVSIDPMHQNSRQKLSEKL